MKVFIVIFAVVACACAASEKREKRAFLGGLSYGDAYSGLYGAHSLGYTAPAISYSAPLLAAPAAKVVTVNKVVNSAHVVDVPQVVNVRKVVSVPRVVSVNKLVAAPSYSTYGSALGYGLGSVYGYGAHSLGYSSALF